MLSTLQNVMDLERNIGRVGMRDVSKEKEVKEESGEYRHLYMYTRKHMKKNNFYGFVL